MNVVKDSEKITFTFSTNICIPDGDLVFEIDESIHFEKHRFIININPFIMNYSVNDIEMCVINDLGLLSIERLRDVSNAYATDSTCFVGQDEDLFTEKEWKTMKEKIPTGP
jgi:hypothetical protein